MANALGLVHPSLLLAVGSSQAGKSSWCVRLARSARELYGHDFTKIIWCYNAGEASAPRAQLADVPGIQFHAGVPDDFDRFPKDSLIFIDDCSQECADSEAVVKLATRGIHHDRKSVVLCLHNLYYKGKNFRTLSLNANYFVLFRALRDRTQIGVFLRQFSPTNWRQYQDVYNREVADKPYRYLFVDCHPASTVPDAFRIRTGIFPDDPGVTVFCSDTQIQHALSDEAAS